MLVPHSRLLIWGIFFFRARKAVTTSSIWAGWAVALNLNETTCMSLVAFTGLSAAGLPAAAGWSAATAAEAREAVMTRASNSVFMVGLRSDASKAGRESSRHS